MRDGDIYFWRYANEMGDHSMTYHCKSRKAVVINGRLVDTFWSSPSEGHVVDPARCVLEFKGNKADLRQIREWEAKYYNDEDVVDMRHSNSSRAEVYVKANAKRSREAMLSHIETMRSEQESVIRSASYRLELLKQSEADIHAGKLDEVCI
jgi:hypothetical protein